MVGAVIVHNGKIIGEGYTSPYGGPHAEVNAIHSVKDKSVLRHATLYVTLEPCCHFGKTPPCSDLIIENQLSKVVIGLEDPNDKVSGRGIAKLQEAGIKVTRGIMAKECKKHHKRFLTFQHKKRPYIILKWAESADGFLAPVISKRATNPEPFWITNTYSRQTVHQWRSEEQAILVGTNTVLLDDPSLTVRDWKGKSPIRIVLDAKLRIPHESNVLNDHAKSMVFCDSEATGNKKKGIEYYPINFKKNIAEQICNVLYEVNINSIIIE